MGAEILIFAKMKLFLFFIGSSFATTCQQHHQPVFQVLSQQKQTALD